MSEVRDIYVRVIYDRKNKWKFEKIYAADFPVTMSVKNMKMELLRRFGGKIAQNGERAIKNIDIGYIGYSNKKFGITTEEDLKMAFVSSMDLICLIPR